MRWKNCGMRLCCWGVIEMGKSSQRKGAAGERELAAILQERGYECTRGGSLTFGEVPDVTGLPGIHVEVKRAEKQNLYAWVGQAEADTQKFQDGLPAVFWRKNRHKWLVVMPLDEWLKLYKWAETAKNGPEKR